MYASFLSLVLFDDNDAIIVAYFSELLLSEILLVNSTVGELFNVMYITASRALARVYKELLIQF